jgi:DNA-binding NarL/FixJ family response regulator
MKTRSVRASAGASDERKRIRVLIADSDAVTRTGVRLALEAGGIEVCAEVAGARELIESVARLAPDVCLVDVDLPGGGLAAAAELGAGPSPRPATIVLAAKIVEDDFRAAVLAGAAGYLPKTVSSARVPAVVRGLLRGEPAVPRSLVAMLIEDMRLRAARRRRVNGDGNGIDLTSREWEVIDLIGEGRSTREVAERLSISEVTVRRHVGSTLKKLGVQTRAAAVELLRS